MNATKAMRKVKEDCIPGIRGVGAAAIIMCDGRKYSVVDENSCLVESFGDDGALIERIDAADVGGKVDYIDWCVDELGGVPID